MWLEWIALTAVCAFGALGAWRGTLATFLRIFGLVLAYSAALLAAPRLGPQVAELAHLPALLGTALAGAVAFAGTLVLFSPVSWLLRRRERRRRGKAARTLPDRLGGALIGVTQGALVAVLIGLFGTWLDAARALAPSEGESRPAPVAPSPLERAATSVLEGAANLALAPEDRGARLAVRLAVRPSETLDHVRALLERRELAELREDELFWSYVENGAIEQALNRASALKLSFDPGLRSELVDLGVLNAEMAADANAFRRELRSVLGEVGPRIKALRQSGELDRLLRDPAIAQAVKDGNTVSLFANPAFRELVYRVLDSPAPAPTDG